MAVTPFKRPEPPAPGPIDWSIHPVAEWLVQERLPPNAMTDFFGELNERLVAAGLPLFRSFGGLMAMHPQFVSRSLIWRRGGETEVVDREYSIQGSPAYYNSPVYVIHQGADSVRRRLDIDQPQLDFEILGDLKAAGATDYVAMPLRLTTGQVNFISWASDRPGGFATGELTQLYSLLPLIALKLEVYAAYDMATTLLETYLGRAAARRVLAGTVRRSEGDEIEAAIFYADMRGFTAMTERVSSKEVIETLDDFFDCLVEPIQSRDGEVLKFLGDGLLAIFPVRAEGIDPCCCHALDAALAAFDNLARLNQRRAERGHGVLRAGIALHVGKVVFGNIGGADRLDFTVIGKAVNEVSRIEELTVVLDQPLLLSAEFAGCECQRPLRSLGFHALLGVREPKELFALADSPPAIAQGSAGVAASRLK